MTKNDNSDLVSRNEAQEMIEKALRRHNRRSTIISSILGWILIGGYSFGLFHVVQNTQIFNYNLRMLDLLNIPKPMRPELENNLREIKKFYIKRSSNNYAYKYDLRKELEEWIAESFQIKDDIWTLPDLTKLERFENFCRSIKKKIN